LFKIARERHGERLWRLDGRNLDVYPGHGVFADFTDIIFVK